MSVPYIPPRDQPLQAWALNFSTKITATPTAYGLTAPIATAFAALYSAYAAALAVVLVPATKTKSTVATKNTAKASLIFSARSNAALVQAFPTITPTQLEDLGLTVRKTTPTPIGPPTTKPLISMLNSSSNTLYWRFADESTPDSRSRPFGAIGMEVWVKVGSTPPVTLADCDFRGIVTQNTFGPGTRSARTVFSGGDAGETAYYLCRWINKRGEYGPNSDLATHTIAA